MGDKKKNKSKKRRKSVTGENKSALPVPALNGTDIVDENETIAYSTSVVVDPAGVVDAGVARGKSDAKRRKKKNQSKIESAESTSANKENQENEAKKEKKQKKLNGEPGNSKKKKPASNGDAEKAKEVSAPADPNPKSVDIPETIPAPTTNPKS